MIRSHEHEDVPLNVNTGSVPGVIVMSEADGLMWMVNWMAPSLNSKTQVHPCQ